PQGPLQGRAVPSRAWRRGSAAAPEEGLSVLVVVCGICALCAIVPALVFRKNLKLYAPPPPPSPVPAVSVLIPARNEEGSIAGAVEAALASRGVEIEVVVLDDQSEDRTAEIVRGIAGRDPWVRLETAPPLPPGW